MPARSKDQRTAANIAMAIKKGKVEPEPGTPSAEMAKMSKKDLKKFTTGKIAKKKTNEGIEGALDQVFAVQKPYAGCQLTSLVKPIDPLVGLGGSEIVPDNVQAVFPDQGAAEKFAQNLFAEYKVQREQLAEKKLKVVEKIKKTMDELEKQRKQHVDMIKENPGDVTKHRQKVSEIATKLDELVNTLERVEKSRKLHEEEEEKGETKKKFTYTDLKTKKEAEIEAKDEKEAKYLVNKKGGDVTTVKEKPEEAAAEKKPEEKEEA